MKHLSVWVCRAVRQWSWILEENWRFEVIKRQKQKLFLFHMEAVGCFQAEKQWGYSPLNSSVSKKITMGGFPDALSVSCLAWAAFYFLWSKIGNPAPLFLQIYSDHLKDWQQRWSHFYLRSQARFDHHGRPADRGLISCLVGVRKWSSWSNRHQCVQISFFCTQCLWDSLAVKQKKKNIFHRLPRPHIFFKGEKLLHLVPQ